MQSALETFLVSGIFAFILTFVRVGSAVIIMPGLGDSFLPTRIRLHAALAISFVMFPILLPFMPAKVPTTFALIHLIAMELTVGLLIGTVARIFMSALDTAGMVISSQSGLANAQVFNPTLAAQGSIIGAFLSMTGAVLVFSTNMHHMLLTGLVESYHMFPVETVPDFGSMAELMSKAVSASFNIGVKLAMPFIVLTLLILSLIHI